MSSVHVVFPLEGESRSALVKRAQQTEGTVLIVLSGLDAILAKDGEERAAFLRDCSEMSDRLYLSTKQPIVVEAARGLGIRVLDQTRHLRQLLEGNPSLDEALRAFSPHLWRQELRSRLQTMGLLSLPRIRIFSLILLSATLFLFIVFRLLPSAEIQVWPRLDPISQTANIFLVQSGATVDIPTRVRTMELYPIAVTVSHALTFDQISKEFVGTSAQVPMVIVNTSQESYAFLKGTRLNNQAGMIFRTQESVTVEPGGRATVPAKADPTDIYGEIIGERGNVPGGVRWEIPGLAPDEQKLVYGMNEEEAKGGKTAYRTVLNKGDLEIAKKRLEQELLAMAKQLTEEERVLRNTQNKDMYLEMLYYTELTKTAFSGFVLPTQFLGEPVTSVPVEGSLTYAEYAYDAQGILNRMRQELLTHVEEGRRLIEDTIRLDRLVVHVIDYADDFSWIKLTVDLTGMEEYILDPLSPGGTKFAKRIREKVEGLTTDEALRIIRNMPEVDRVEISMWPPWHSSLPGISSQIFISPQ